MKKATLFFVMILSIFVIACTADVPERIDSQDPIEQPTEQPTQEESSDENEENQEAEQVADDVGLIDEEDDVEIGSII